MWVNVFCQFIFPFSFLKDAKMKIIVLYSTCFKGYFLIVDLNSTCPFSCMAGNKQMYFLRWLQCRIRQSWIESMWLCSCSVSFYEFQTNIIAYIRVVLVMHGFLASIQSFTLLCELYCAQCIVFNCIAWIPTFMTVSTFF